MKFKMLDVFETHISRGTFAAELTTLVNDGYIPIWETYRTTKDAFNTHYSILLKIEE